MPKLLRYIALAFLLLAFRYFFSFLVFSQLNFLSEDSLSLLTVPDFWMKHEIDSSYELAENGYGPINNLPSEDPNLFKIEWYILPLFPVFLNFAIRVAESVNLGMYAHYVGPLLATLFLGLALFFLDKLLEKVWLYDDKKYFVILLFLFFPSAYLLTMSGSLSLFILLSILFFYFLFQRKYALAALFLSLSMSTKLVSIFYVIPFFYFVSMAERYNPKFPKTSRSLGYLSILVTPILICCYHVFEKTGDFFLFFRPSYWVEKFSFVPFAPLVKFLGAKNYLVDTTSTINAFAVIILSAMIIYVFIRMYFIFENRSLEQNALFMTGFISLLVVSTLPLNLPILSVILAIVPFFMLFAMVANFPVRSPGFLSLLFIMVNIQTLMFINFLM